MGLTGGLMVKNPPSNAGKVGSILVEELHPTWHRAAKPRELQLLNLSCRIREFSNHNKRPQIAMKILHAATKTQHSQMKESAVHYKADSQI